MTTIPYRYIIITDASFKKDGDKPYCGYGVVILNTQTMQYVKFSDYIGEYTIAYGELWAIYRGIEKALKFIGKHTDAKILVVTDSKLCVNSFAYYIPKRIWDLSDWYNWKTVKRKPVKNQVVYRQTLELLRKYPKVSVRIAHIHGHMTKKRADKIKTDLEKHGIHADSSTVEMFRQMNGIVDEIAKEAVDRQIRLDNKYGEVDLVHRTCLMNLEMDDEDE